MTFQPADPAGAETLAIMEAAPQYNDWQYRRIAPYLGRRVCEVGAGIGNISALIDRSAPELLVLADTDPYYREHLRARFAERPAVVVEDLTLPAPDAGERFHLYRLDTVVALNVVEHIPDDLDALRSVAAMLAPGGRVVLLVPAFQALYGSLDEELSHARRYTVESMADLLRRAGFEVERSFYFNAVGALGWWFNARIRRVPRIPIAQLRFFDSLVPMLRMEDRLPLPFGQSVIAVGRVR